MRSYQIHQLQSMLLQFRQIHSIMVHQLVITTSLIDSITEIESKTTVLIDFELASIE